MVTVTYSNVQQLRDRVVFEMGRSGIFAEGYHSGGGIYGVRIESPGALSSFFTTLDGEGTDAWTGLDWHDSSGELVATLEVQVRPYNPNPTYATGPDTAADIAAAICRVVERVL